MVFFVEWYSKHMLFKIKDCSHVVFFSILSNQYIIITIHALSKLVQYYPFHDLCVAGIGI
jgi:hypothetical protein